MLVFKCDRCGQTFENTATEVIKVMSTGEGGKVNRLYGSDRDAIGYSVSIDLCPSCVKSLQKWLDKRDGSKNDRP